MSLTSFIKNVSELQQFNAFLDELAKEFSEPVFPEKEEAAAVLERVRNLHSLSKQFYMVAKSTDISIPFHHKLESYLPIKGTVNADKFLNLLHPDYAADYLRWGLAAYVFLHAQRYELEPFKYFFRIIYPMKLRDNNYHWVLMESTPFQLDKDRNMITHFNVYTVLNPYNSDRTLPLIGEAWDNEFRNELWTLELAKYRFESRPFLLTRSQKTIIEVINGNPKFTNAQIAEYLDKGKNTVDTQNKQILEKAKKSFPHRGFSKVKELVEFLDSIGYFTKGFEPLVSKVW